MSGFHSSRTLRILFRPDPDMWGSGSSIRPRARAKQTNDRKSKKAKRPAKKNNGKSAHAPKQASKGKPEKTGAPKGANGSDANPGTNAPKQIPLAVHEFMRDKQFHGLDEIVGAVRKKLGDSILPLSVRGALSSKKSFEKNDAGMYRLLS